MTRENEKLRLYFCTNNVEARHQLLLCKIENEIVSGSFGLSYLLFIFDTPYSDQSYDNMKKAIFLGYFFLTNLFHET